MEIWSTKTKDYSGGVFGEDSRLEVRMKLGASPDREIQHLIEEKIDKLFEDIGKIMEAYEESLEEGVFSRWNNASSEISGE